MRFLVVGAGMAGVLMGIRLKEAGYTDYLVVELSDKVGGTWHANHYPGLHCDVPSHHYCYSFEPNPDWTEVMSGGPEIREYIERAAIKYGVMPNIRFDTAAKSAFWDGARWRVTLSDDDTIEADVVITATGGLRIPQWPDIEGLDSFAGPMFHTTGWDHDVDLSDKRVGLIGTGSTAVQITCALSGNVGNLSLFQRTAQWVQRLPNGTYTEEEKARFRANPQLMIDLYDEFEAATYVQTGGAIMGNDPAARAALIENVDENLATVRDPELRRKLTPDYKVGCKRLVISPNFYEAIQDPSVELVTDKIVRIAPEGVLTANGRLHELDVLVLATGFDPTAYLRPMSVTGENGVTLDELWSVRPTAYKSMGLPHMPNFFMIEGPFTPFGNLSLIRVAEWQVDYIMKCIDMIRECDIAMSPTPEVTAELIHRYREAAKTTIWATGGCVSWYQDEEGVPIIYPYSPQEFRDEVKAPLILADWSIRPLTGANVGEMVTESGRADQ